MIFQRRRCKKKEKTHMLIQLFPGNAVPFLSQDLQEIEYPQFQVSPQYSSLSLIFVPFHSQSESSVCQVDHLHLLHVHLICKKIN